MAAQLVNALDDAFLTAELTNVGEKCIIWGKH